MNFLLEYKNIFHLICEYKLRIKDIYHLELELYHWYCTTNILDHIVDIAFVAKIYLISSKLNLVLFRVSDWCKRQSEKLNEIKIHRSELYFTHDIIFICISYQNIEIQKYISMKNIFILSINALNCISKFHQII